MIFGNALNQAIKAGETMRVALEATAPLRQALEATAPLRQALEATAPLRDALARAEALNSPTLRALRTAAEVAAPLRAAFEATSPLSRLSDAMVTSPGLQPANAISPIAHATIFGWASPYGSSKARDDVAAPSQPGLPLLGYADPSKAPTLASPEAPAVQPSTDVAAHAALELSPVAVPSEEASPPEAEAARDVQCPTDDVAGPATALDFSSWPEGLRAMALEVGPELALEIAKDYGGAHFTLPKNPRPGHELAERLGAAYGRVRARLLESRGASRPKRERVYIHRPRGGELTVRKQRVLELLEAGWTNTSEIAREAGVTERYVQQIRKELAELLPN